MEILKSTDTATSYPPMQVSTFPATDFESKSELEHISNLLSEDFQKQRLSALALAALPRIQNDTALAAVLSSENPLSVKLGLFVIVEHKLTSCVPAITQLLTRTDSALTIGAALWALGNLDAKDSISTIMKFLESPYIHVQQEAAISLGKLKATDALPQIRELAKTQHPDLKKGAERALRYFETDVSASS